LCGETKIKERRKVSANWNMKPKTLEGFQQMFKEIYPNEKRTLEHAGVHLAEELGEFSESLMVFKGTHRDDDFSKIIIEAADFFSCIVGIFSSLGMNIAKEISEMFSENCHVCKKAPCECTFSFIANFES
jgi:NTP pyrophosphatase (non-canonical NTP hydrolase)